MHLLLRGLDMVLCAQRHHYLNGGTVSDEVGGGDDFDTRWRTKMYEGVDDGSVEGMDGRTGRWGEKGNEGLFFLVYLKKKVLSF